MMGFRVVENFRGFGEVVVRGSGGSGKWWFGEVVVRGSGGLGFWVKSCTGWYVVIVAPRQAWPPTRVVPSLREPVPVPAPATYYLRHVAPCHLVTAPRSAGFRVSS
jgi:hypothetical protein